MMSSDVSTIQARSATTVLVSFSASFGLTILSKPDWTRSRKIPPDQWAPKKKKRQYQGERLIHVDIRHPEEFAAQRFRPAARLEDRGQPAAESRKTLCVKPGMPEKGSLACK